MRTGDGDDRVDGPDPILAELDAIEDELVRLPPRPAPAKRPLPPPVVYVPTEPPPDPPRRPAPPPAEAASGRPSLYLEERLSGARDGLSLLREDIREIAHRSARADRTSATVADDLEKAASELAFIRARGLFAEDPERRPSDLPAPSDDPPERLRRDPVPPGAASEREGWTRMGEPVRPSETADGARYPEFTAVRYRATIRAAKRRWPIVSVVTLLTATAVSGGLVGLTYLLHAPAPPWWVEALPAVWLIPVPFFALSFRGTHRMLGRDRFDLSGSP